MSVRLRLRREGTKKAPHYRIVAADRRSPRDGRFIEIIGSYNPRTDPSTIEIDEDRALYWLRNGAQPTNQVANLLQISGVWEQFRPGEAGAREERARERARRAEQRSAAASQVSGGGDRPADQAAAAPEDLEPPEAEAAAPAAETEAPAAPEGAPGEGVAAGASAPEETAAGAASEEEEA